VQNKTFYFQSKGAAVTLNWPSGWTWLSKVPNSYGASEYLLKLSVINSKVFATATEIPGVYSMDSDVTAYWTAANVTDPTQRAAIDTFVAGLKANGFWSGEAAIYPLVGSLDYHMGVNLRNPATYALQFHGGGPGAVTYSARGATFDGTSGTYADTGITPSTASGLTATSTRVFAYLDAAPDPQSGNTYLFGCSSSSSAQRLFVRRDSPFDLFGEVNGNSGGTFQPPGSQTFSAMPLGAIMIQRDLANDYIYVGMATLALGTAATALPSNPIHVCSYDNNGTASAFFKGTVSGFAVGPALSPQQYSVYLSLWQAFQAALGRAH
jgi:hypothetical protein